MTALAVPLPPDDELRMPVKVLRVPTLTTWSVTVTATKPATIYTHFWDGRTVRCGQPGQDCFHCRQGTHRQWEAYLGVFNRSVGRDMVLVLPALCWRELSEALGERVAGGLRGVRLTLQRYGKDRRGRVKGTVDALPAAGDAPPRGLDIVAILCRLWRCTRADLGF